MTLAVMLSGIALDIWAGAPELSEQPIGGSRVLRMSDGAGIKQTHWQKMSGALSGQGLLPVGLDGLDYSAPLELRTTLVSSMQGAGLVYQLPTMARPDRAPWAMARLGNYWRTAACALADGKVTVVAVAGADQYRVHWMPVYSVWVEPPSRTQSAAFGWSLSWEEV